MTKINPATVFTPKGFQRLKRNETLREGDMFLHCTTFQWMKCDLRDVSTNRYTNCIRPIKLLTN